MQIGTWHTRAGGFDILRSIPKTATSEAGFEEFAARARTAEISVHTRPGRRPRGCGSLQTESPTARRTTKRYPSWTSFVKPLAPLDYATPPFPCNRRSRRATRSLPAPSPTDPGQETNDDHAARNWTAEVSSAPSPSAPRGRVGGHRFVERRSNGNAPRTARYGSAGSGADSCSGEQRREFGSIWAGILDDRRLRGGDHPGIRRLSC
jgi:hypothetical protein